MGEKGAPGGGWSLPGFDAFRNWSISSSRFINQDATSVWGRVRWGDLFLGQLKGLVALLTGLWVYWANSIPASIIKIQNAVRSFVVEVVTLVVSIPGNMLRGSFDTVQSTLMGNGMAGYAAALVLTAAAFIIYAATIRVVSGG